MLPRSKPELVFDCLLAASLVLWAVLGLRDFGVSDVRVAIAALHLTIAYALVHRSTPAQRASVSDVLMSLPAIGSAGLALRVAAPVYEWPIPARAVFLLGSLVTIGALIGLGKSFAVLPARRNLVVGGPYRFVRHPAYAGELMMLLACFLARPVLTSAAVALLSVPFVALRIGAEERLLARFEDYLDYRRAVRWRLVPGLW